MKIGLKTNTDGGDDERAWNFFIVSNMNKIINMYDELCNMCVILRQTENSALSSY